MPSPDNTVEPSPSRDSAPSARSERIFRLVTSRRAIAIHLAVFVLGAAAFVLFGSA